MEPLQLVRLVGALSVFLALWQRKAAPATTIGEMFKWHPIWKQRDDFTRGGWIMWVSGWSLLVVYMVIMFFR